MALGNTAAASKIVSLNALPLRGETARGHTIHGLQNNLVSMNELTKEGYVPIFDDNKLSVYDAHTTTFTVLQKSILEGWYLPHEGLWQSP